MYEMNMLAIKSAGKVARRVIMQNKSNIQRHFPDKVDKYTLPKSPKKKEEYLKDYDKPNNEPTPEQTKKRPYLDPYKVNPHVLMKAIEKQMNMSEQEKKQFMYECQSELVETLEQAKSPKYNEKSKK